MTLSSEAVVQSSILPEEVTRREIQGEGRMACPQDLRLRRKPKAVPGSSGKSVVLGSRRAEVRGRVRGQGLYEAQVCGHVGSTGGHAPQSGDSGSGPDRGWEKLEVEEEAGREGVGEI